LNNIQIAGQYKVLTASANCSPIPATMLGFLCSTNTNGTVTVYDDPATGTGTPITGTITVAAATWYPLPVSTTKGLYVAITGTTSVTIVYAAE
jgi:phosphate/sulfate permease